MMFQSAFAAQEDQRLDHFFGEVTTLEADFVQRVLDEEGELVQESTGKVQLHRPGRFRWEYDMPYKQIILTDGESLWIYDPALEQATVRDIDEALGAAPITLLSEGGPLEEEFTVRALEPHDGLDWVELTPKVQDTEFTRIELGLGEDGVQQMRLYDRFGQTTVIELENLRTDVEIPASRFEFDPPPGTDVIGAIK